MEKLQEELINKRFSRLAHLLLIQFLASLVIFKVERQRSEGSRVRGENNDEEV